MKRLQRAIIAILCIVCLAFGAIACGDDDEGTEATYTVTVTGDVSSMELSITTVKLLKENGEDATAATHLTLNDKKSEGTATFKLEKGKYTVVIDGDFGDRVPTGNTQLTSSVRSTTITIGKEPIVPVVKQYKVRFVYPDNTPVANLEVQICSNQCHTATTDENGWATWNLAADEYEVHVPKENWPNGYYFDDAAYTLTATKLEITAAKFQAYAQHTVTVKYAAYDSTWNQWEPSTPAANVSLKISKYDDYTGGGSSTALATATTNADGIATFSAPDIDLWADITGGATSGYVQEKGASNHIDSDDENPLVIVLYPVGATVNSGAELKLDTATSVSVLESGSIWYEFKPTQSGEYTLTSTGNVDASCTMPSAISFTGDLSASNEKDGDNFTVTFNVGASEIGGNRWVFKIDAAEGTFSVNLTRTGDYEEQKTPDREKVNATGVTATAEMLEIPAETKFKFLDPDLIIKKDDAGFYHLDSKDGPIVYASIGGKYAPAGISGGFQGIIESPTGTQSITLTDGETYNYDYTDFIKEYIKGLNDDGLYPLNDELKTFLTLYSKLLGYYEPTYEYACGTYASMYSQLIGGSSVQTGDYRFDVAAGETKTLTYTPKFFFDTNPVAVTVTSGSVKLLDSEDTEATKLVLYPNESFSVKNEGGASVTVVLHVAYNTADKQIADLGEYLVIASEWGTEYEFTAPAANTYTFVLEEGTVDVVDENDNTTSGEPVELAAGQKVTLVVYTPLGVNEDTVTTLTIAIYTPPTPLDPGANTVTGTADGAAYVFTATESGDYTITYDATGWVQRETDGGEEYIASGETITLAEGETITLICYPEDQSADSETFSLTIAKVEE